MPERSRPEAPSRVLPAPGLFVTRGLLYLIVLALASSAVWAAWAKVDVVVTARGRLLPRAGVLKLCHPQGGIVSEILVDVGARVNEGDVLVRIDAFREDADTESQRHELEAAQAEWQRHRETSRRLRDVVSGSREELTGLERIREILLEELDAVRRLQAREIASTLEVGSKERELEEVQARIARIRAELARTEEEIDRNERLAMESDAKARAVEVGLVRAVEARRRMDLATPKSGIVTQLAALRPGLYVGPKDVVASILPDDEPLWAEIKIPNESMRRVRAGLPVRLKVGAYPYQDYGILPGRLVSIDPNADETGSYRAWIWPERLTLSGPHGPERMRPGLEITAETIVDRRSVIQVVLDPFRRLSHSTLED